MKKAMLLKLNFERSKAAYVTTVKVEIEKRKAAHLHNPFRITGTASAFVDLTAHPHKLLCVYTSVSCI